MANALNLLFLLASLAVWQSAADDACDSVECLPSSESVCAQDEDSGSIQLFADECVLRCTNCKMDTEFKKVNSSLCSVDAKQITVCQDFALNQDNEETQPGGPDGGIAVVEIDIGSDGDDGVPPVFGEPLPLPLPLLSMGSELLRRLVMSSQPEPPPQSPEGLTLITADFKVDVTINMPGAPPPLPPAPRPGVAPPLALPPPLILGLPRMPLLAPPPPPPPPPHFLEVLYRAQQPDVYSAASPTARLSAAAAVASLVAMAVAAIHI